MGGLVVYFAVGGGAGATIGLEGGTEDEFTIGEGGREGGKAGRVRMIGRTEKDEA
jgi:hypothetical protein